MIEGTCILRKTVNGTDAVLYSIVPSAASVTYNINTEVSTPSFITVKLKKTVGATVTYPSVLPDGVKMWYKLDTDSSYGQVANNGYVYQDGWGTAGYIEVYLTNNGSAPGSTKSNVISGITIPFIQTGVNGTNAVTYSILNSVNVIQNSNGVMSPSTITCTKYKQVGGQTPIITTEKTLKYKQSDESTETVYSGSITISDFATYIDFILYDTDGITVLDKERVPVISDGISVYSVDVQYAISTSNVVAPVLGWQATAPSWQNGSYIWTRTIIMMSDGSESSTNAVCISGGKGILSITEYYYKSTSSSSLTGGSWRTSAPTWESGYYIWTKSIIKYTDNSESETSPINVTGGKGDTGVSAYLLDLTNEISSVTCDKSGNVIGTLQGTTAILYCGINTVLGVAFSALFEGCSGSIDATTGVVTMTGLTANTGTVTITATYQSQSFTAVYTITKVFSGGDGIDGWGLSLSPSNIAIGDKSDGSLDLTTATASVIATYGSNTANIEKNGELQCVNCTAAYNATTNVLSITKVNVQDVTYTYNGEEYQTTAYCPNGYVILPVKASYETKNVILTLRLDFTVSGFIATQENNLRVTKVITDNNTIKVDVATISQKADDICLSISESYMDTLEKNGNGAISIFDVTGSSLCQYQDGNFLQMQGNSVSHIVVLGKSITGLTVGIEYTVHFLIKQNAGDGPINLFAGNTAGGENIMVCDLTGADEIGTYKDYGGFNDITGTFKATAATMVVGFKIILNDSESYLDIDVNGLTIGYDIASKLKATGIDIKNKIITATADSFVIQDNNGNVNAIFELVNGIPMLKANYIQANKIIAPKVKTSETGVRTEIVNDMISQYNADGELMVRIHGGTLNDTSDTINIATIDVNALNITKSGSNGLRQEFDIPLSDTFAYQVLSLMNTIKVLDDSYAANVPIDCTIICANVKGIGYELYVSDVMGENMSGALIWTEYTGTGTMNLTKGMSGTAVMSSAVARANCKIYVHFIIEFNNALGSFSIKNESLLGVSITYGGNATEIARDGIILRFGQTGFKVTAAGLFKMTSSTNGQWVSI